MRNSHLCMTFGQLNILWQIIPIYFSGLFSSLCVLVFFVHVCLSYSMFFAIDLHPLDRKYLSLLHAFIKWRLLWTNAVSSSYMNTAPGCIPWLLSTATTYCTVPTCSATSLCLVSVWLCVIFFLFLPFSHSPVFHLPLLNLNSYASLLLLLVPNTSTLFPLYSCLFWVYSFFIFCQSPVSLKSFFSFLPSWAISAFPPFLALFFSLVMLPVYVMYLSAHGGVLCAPSCLP